MTINVKDLLTEIDAVAELKLSEGVSAFQYMGEEIAFKGDVLLVGEIKRMQSKYYTFCGNVNATLILHCGNCTDEFDYDISFPLDIHFMDKEKAIDNEVDLYYTDGITVSFDEAIQTNAMMYIPMKRLCRPDCKGLCPHCGAKLDDKCCDCGHDDDCDDSIDARFAVLKDFFNK